MYVCMYILYTFAFTLSVVCFYFMTHVLITHVYMLSHVCIF